MDHGLEHGPKEFNMDTIDPEYVLDVAVKGNYNGMIVQKGIAERYYEHYRHKVPLILKLNGKTNIAQNDPYSPINCSVKRAVELGAQAVGFTIFVGSPQEAKIFHEFGKIQEEAHEYGLPVIAWMYPRGKFVNEETSIDTLAYAARVGLELGADILKMKFNPDIQGYKWVVKCAGNVPLLCAGETKLADKEFLQRTQDIMSAGASGMAIGRNVWQHHDPLGMTKALKKIIFEKASVEAALKCVKNEQKKK
ncbi:Fructose-bisphosphate aldolase class 1 [sediment metagenome]|uniref:Fructose-bisphosphate aldolase class 1 n=1 Tax=sediment metagenome TaxID=749907 RepID=D9PEX3_9ZZZZ